MNSMSDNWEADDRRPNVVHEATGIVDGVQLDTVHCDSNSGGTFTNSNSSGRGQSNMRNDRSRGYQTSEMRRNADDGVRDHRQIRSNGGERRADFDSSNVSVNSGSNGGGWNRRSDVNSSQDFRGYHPSQGSSGQGDGRRSRTRSFDAGANRDDRYSYYTNYPEDDSRRNSRDVTSRDRYYGDDHQEGRHPSSQSNQGADGSVSSARDRIGRSQSGNCRSRSFERSSGNSLTKNEDKDTDSIEKEISKKQAQAKVEWPPSFETDGSSFVFDVRSAMFYESVSDFFYDPKSKLYYGNRKGAYFRYDKTKDPPFVEVQAITKSDIGEGENNDGGFNQVVVTATSKSAPNTPAVPKIAIKLKTKKLKSKTSSQDRSERPTVATGAPTVSVSKTQKEQIANIEKWTEKQAELNEGTSSAAANAIAGRGSNELVSESQRSGETSKVRTTAKGEPICVICKRKFPSIDKLQLHEKASDLHKRNLEALQEAKQRDAKRKADEVNPNESSAGTGPVSSDASLNNSSTSTAQYQDRAQKRRQLHGFDSSVAIAASRAVGISSVDLDGGAPQISSGGLDETNVGHKMLQKMGYNNVKKDTTNDPLRREWDRIERIAGRNGPRSTHYGPQDASF